MTRFEELTEKIAAGWGDFPPNRIPADWRERRPGETRKTKRRTAPTYLEEVADRLRAQAVHAQECKRKRWAERDAEARQRRVREQKERVANG